MKLYIKQQVLTLGERFTVKNELGEDVYYVEGSFFRIPKEFTIYNCKREVVGHIERQLFRFFARYNINDQKDTMVLKREFSFFRQNYSLENTNWSLQGNFTGHHYEVVQDERPIMTLRKHWFTWGDSYELDIPNQKDEILALSIAICVDNEILKDQQNSSAA